MILTIIFIVLLIIGIIGLIIYWCSNSDDILCDISAILALLSGLALVISLIWITSVQLNVESVYQAYKTKRENIIVELTKASKLTISITNTDLGSRIDNYNSFILQERIMSGNPWTSWFHNAKVGSLDTISVADYYTAISK